MKQVLQNINTGETFIENVPVPTLEKNYVLIKNKFSVISPGTESMLIDFGKGNLVQKIFQQPDKAKEVFHKIKNDGLAATYDAVTSKLDTPIPLGYSSCGIVHSSESSYYQEGDRVISNGFHAEFVKVGQNLCAKIPEGVEDIDASFTVLGSIALQSIRLLNPSLGESVIVFGLGPIGNLACQILAANGCRVVGADINQSRCKELERLGFTTINPEDEECLIHYTNKYTNNNGFDGALISAKTSDSSLVNLTAKLSRKRGNIVLVGTAGLEIDRTIFYEKELTFQVSCSYGPGRYDKSYEHNGVDYPIGFVRWTEQRNFQSFLELLASKRINLDGLKGNIYNLDEAAAAYKSIESKLNLTAVLSYPSTSEIDRNVSVSMDKFFVNNTNENCTIGFLGSGNYASRVLAPQLKKSDCILKTIVSKNGLSSKLSAKKNGFEFASSSEDDVFSDSEINTVFIATRHNLHAQQVLRAIKAKKHIFVEKPLAINLEELEKIEEALCKDLQEPNSLLMVGFNRRFSPLIKKLKDDIDFLNQPFFINIDVNAGALPEEHWLKNPGVGGGRLIGEACHFIDLSRYIANSEIINSHVFSNKIDYQHDENFVINLSFKNGSMANIKYFACGNKGLPKENIQVICAGHQFNIVNFKKYQYFGSKNIKNKTLLFQDKGQKICLRKFIDSVTNGGTFPIPIKEIIEVSKVTIELSNELYNK